MAAMLSQPTGDVVVEDDRSGPAAPAVATDRSAVAAAIEHVLQGNTFIAVTAESGDATPATVIHQALLARSIRSMTVRRGEDGTLGLKAMAAQLLDKRESRFDPQDIEDLFDVLTAHEGAGQRVTLVIDDAERLQPDAVSYLCLLSTLAKSAAPQVVFAGRPDFWNMVDRGSASQLGSLITARFGAGSEQSGDSAGQTSPAPSQDVRPESPARPDAEDAKSVAAVADPKPFDAWTILSEGAKAKRRSSVIGRLVGITALAVVAYAAGETAFRYAMKDARQTDTPVALPGPETPANGPITKAASNDSPAIGALPDRMTTVIPLPAKGPPPTPTASAKEADPPTGASDTTEKHSGAIQIPAVSALGQPTPSDNVPMERPRPTEPPAPDAAQGGSTAMSGAMMSPPSVGGSPASHAGTDGGVAATTTPDSRSPSASIPLLDSPVSLPINPAAPVSSPKAPTAEIEALLARGDAALALGDLAGARLLFEKAASLGNAHAATVVGKTYDPLILPTILARGVTPNPAVAAAWYRRAAVLGDAEADDRLARLTAARKAN